MNVVKGVCNILPSAGTYIYIYIWFSIPKGGDGQQKGEACKLLWQHSLTMLLYLGTIEPYALVVKQCTFPLPITQENLNKHPLFFVQMISMCACKNVVQSTRRACVHLPQVKTWYKQRWSLMRGQFPSLHREVLTSLFMKYNTALPSSAAVEDMFSTAGDVLIPKHTSMVYKRFVNLDSTFHQLKYAAPGCCLEKGKRVWVREWETNVECNFNKISRKIIIYIYYDLFTTYPLNVLKNIHRKALRNVLRNVLMPTKVSSGMSSEIPLEMCSNCLEKCPRKRPEKCPQKWIFPILRRTLKWNKLTMNNIY